MIMQPLTTDERAGHPGATHVAIIKHDDLTETAASTAQTKSPATLAAYMACKLIEMQLKKPFRDSTDPAHNSTLVTIGDAGSATRFLASTELNANGTYIQQSLGTGTEQTYTAADAVACAFTPATGKNLAALNEGELRLYLRISDARGSGAQ